MKRARSVIYTEQLAFVEHFAIYSKFTQELTESTIKRTLGISWTTFISDSGVEENDGVGVMKKVGCFVIDGLCYS